MRPTPGLATATGAVIIAVSAVMGPVGAMDIDSDGGITYRVTFFHNPDLTDSTPTDQYLFEPGAQAHYCAAFEEFSKELYQTTEGRHWIKRAVFFNLLDRRQADVEWNYIQLADAWDSEACFHGSSGCRIWLREDGAWPPDYPNPRTSPFELGTLLDHESGHYLYGLPDEYVNFNDYRGGGTGFCAGNYSISGGEGTGTICDEETPCLSGGPCVFKNQCIASNLFPLGSECYHDAESRCSPGSDECDDDGCPTCALDEDCTNGWCQPGCSFGGICLGANPARDDQAGSSTKRICLRSTNLPDPIDDVCLMYGAGRRRWCDGGRDLGVQVPGANHVYTSPLGADYDQDGMNDVQFDLGNTPGEPVPEDTKPGDEVRIEDFLGHSCWFSAKTQHVDLITAHKVGQDYTEFADFERPWPGFQCDWKVDMAGASPHAAVLVDKSGSMAYGDPSEPPVPAVELAADGAKFVYNEIVPDGNYAGIYMFDSATTTATSDTGATTYEFRLKSAEIDDLDPVGAAGGTDIAEALRTAIDDILASSAPAASRNIILFSDGKSNDIFEDPYFEAQRACEADIFVHTIAYGDADSAALEKLSTCGTSWVAGTEQAQDPLFAEPDPLEIKSAMARMGHQVAGQVEVLESAALLEPLTVSTEQTRDFIVPPAAQELVFDWLGNRTCVLESVPPAACVPVLNLLQTVELISPSNVHHAVGLPPGAEGSVYRSIRVAMPEAGRWTARLDKTEPVPAPSTIPGEWDMKVEATAVVWTAHVTHPGLDVLAWVEDDRKPVDAPVVIKARVSRGAGMTNLNATARVTHAGNEWLLDMHDDGQHFDEDRLDGIHAAVFNPDGDWTGVGTGAYRVKVRFEATPGSTQGVPPGEPIDANLGNVTVFPDPGHVVVEAETSFRLSTRYSIDPDGELTPGSVTISCPQLVRGQTYPGLVADVSGIRVDAGSTRMSLGQDIDVSVTAVNCASCADTSTDPGGSITFDVFVDPAAETGFRRILVQEQFDIVRGNAACRVCSVPGDETCNGRDDDCNGLVDEDAAGIEDLDGDTVLQVCDNCPFDANLTQTDSDSDGEGDRCDTDDGRVTLVFTSNTHLDWDAESRNSIWNVYRANLGVLKTTGVYTQVPGSNADADRFCAGSDTFFDDTHIPLPGETAAYLVTFGSGATESSLGQDSDGAERPNDNACPGGPPT